MQKTDIEAMLLIAARNFVRPERRDRFLHEATKRPADMMRRVCHDIEVLFKERFKNGACSFQDCDGCVMFTIIGHMTFTTWGKAMEEIAARGGGGYLVIDKSGRHFFAQAEGFPPSIHFAGDA